MLQISRSGPEWSVNAQLGGWRKIGQSTFVSNNYFDLAGMSMQEKTLFFEAAGVQTTLSPLASGSREGDSCIIVDLMCTKPLTDSALEFVAAYGNFAGPTADGDGPLSYEETVYARTQMFVRHLDTSAWGYITMTDENFFGSMEPTSSDRIYSYRVVIASLDTSGTAMDSLTIYPGRHLLRAVAKEEETYQYIMRLMKSYRLQQEPDVD